MYSEPKIAVWVVLLHVAMEGLLAGQLLVAVEVEVCQGFHLAQLGGDWACQLVGAQEEVCQCSNLAQLGGDRACQLVVVQKEGLQSAELPQLRGDWA